VAARVELRALRPEDAAGLQAFREANRKFLRPCEPTRDEGFYTLEAALAAIEVQQAECEAGRGYAFGIFDAGGLVGYVNLNAVVRGVFQNAYLGSRSQSGRTAEATPRRRCARRRGSRSRNFGLHRVQAAVMPRNAGSIGVLE
jgi:ribosomal-protein-alanine N-acetyltransferase